MQVSLTIHHIFALYLSRGADEDRHAVTEWLMLTSQKKLQCFLGFTNFCSCIWNYSQVVWSPDSEVAFYKLKEPFTSAGLLVSVFSSLKSPIAQVQYISSQMLSHASSQKMQSAGSAGQILPASCTVGALTWDLEETIQRALSDDPN